MFRSSEDVYYNRHYRKSQIFIISTPSELVNFLYKHNLQHYLKNDTYSYNDDLVIFIYDIMTLANKYIYDPIDGITRDDVTQLIIENDIFSNENEIIFYNVNVCNEFIDILLNLMKYLLQNFSENNILNNEKVVLEVTSDCIVFEVKVYE